MRHEVTDADSAVALGSGDVPVLATPRLIAWMEAQTVQEAQPLLSAGQTTVGITIRVQHLRATPVGGVVEVTATPPIEAESRRLTFTVLAVDGSGRIVAQGEIERAVVERDRFLAGASAAGASTAGAGDGGSGADAGH
ncbi:MAG TPA: thioesterase [Actinocrinis sp.]|nr:thioesterase [Actinocrinis sp.]